MKNPPAFQHYPADFLTETFDLSVDEVGAYIRLLSHAWKSEPVGTLPDDDARLARLAGIDCSSWQQMRPTVLRFFTLGKDGRWHHPALRIQYEDRRRLAKARAESVRHRWEKEGRNQKQNAACKPLGNNVVDTLVLQTPYKVDTNVIQIKGLQSLSSPSVSPNGDKEKTNMSDSKANPTGESPPVKSTDISPGALDNIKAEYKPGVIEVFQHWQKTLGHPKSKLDKGRAGAVARQLKAGYSVDDLKAAVDGNKASPYHQGTDRIGNPAGTVHDDLELICRDAKHVEMFMAKVNRATQPAAESKRSTFRF